MNEYIIIEDWAKIYHVTTKESSYRQSFFCGTEDQCKDFAWMMNVARRNRLRLGDCGCCPVIDIEKELIKPNVEIEPKEQSVWRTREVPNW